MTRKRNTIFFFQLKNYNYCEDGLIEDIQLLQLLLRLELSGKNLLVTF